jgi:hypothetical protein
MSEPLAMPADEFALVRRVAEAIGIDPSVPMTPAQHEAWHAAMAPDLSAMTMTDEQAAEFAERFKAAMAEGSLTHRVIQPRPPLTPDEIRALLRECVTVVKFSETLIIRVPSGSLNPQQHRELSDVVRYQGRENGFRAMLVMGDELGIAEAAS